MSVNTIKKGRWKLVTEEHVGGGLFELEIRKRFYIYDQTTDECILCFHGEVDCSYSTSGVGWEYNSSHGVREVTLEEDSALISFGSREVRYQLPLRQLTSEEVLSLNVYFLVFKKSKKKYNYEVDWSSEVSIPSEAIAKSREDMKEAWGRLSEELEAMGLNNMVFSNMILPKRIKGGKAQVKDLFEWMENSGHLLDGLIFEQ